MFNFNQNKRNRSGLRNRGKNGKEQGSDSNEKSKKPFKSPASGGKKAAGKKNKKDQAEVAAPQSPGSDSNSSKDGKKNKQIFDPKYYEDPETRDSYRQIMKIDQEKPLCVADIMESAGCGKNSRDSKMSLKTVIEEEND